MIVKDNDNHFIDDKTMLAPSTSSSIDTKKNSDVSYKLHDPNEDEEEQAMNDWNSSSATISASNISMPPPPLLQREEQQEEEEEEEEHQSKQPSVSSLKSPASSVSAPSQSLTSLAYFSMDMDDDNNIDGTARVSFTIPEKDDPKATKECDDSSEDVFHETSEQLTKSIIASTNNDRIGKKIKNNNSSSHINNLTEDNLKQQNTMDGLLLSIVRTDSDAPLLLYHPDQQSVSRDNEIIRIVHEEENIAQGKMNQLDMKLKDLHLSNDNDDVEEEDENHHCHGNQIDNEDDESYQLSYASEKKETASSSLDNLMKAASRPTFERMVSYSKIDDPVISHAPLADGERVVRDLEGECSSYMDMSSEMNDSDNDSSSKDSFQVKDRTKSDEKMTNKNKSNHSSHGSSSSVSSITSWSRRINTITNKDTGQSYDIRDLTVKHSVDDKDILEVKYFLFPSKDDLLEIHKRKSILHSKDFEVDADDNDSKSVSPMQKTRERLTKSRIAVSTTTSRVISKASKSISKSFLRRTKSDTEALSSTSILQDNELLEPFPTTKLSTVIESVKNNNGSADADDSDKKSGTKSPRFSRKALNLQNAKKKQPKIPVVVAPPKNTLPVKCVNKSKQNSDFNPMILITTLTKAHDGPIWRASFSKDSNYLATAGADGVLNVWKVAPTIEELRKSNLEEWFDKVDKRWLGSWDEETENIDELKTFPTNKSETDAIGTEITLISPHPIQSFKEHTKDIADISWSHSGYLLTASMDKTVRLWHPSIPKSLHQFNHPEEVTSVSFHPSDDRYFLSGGYDKRLRIWQIIDGRVVQWSHVPHIITTASYQPDGKRIAAGLLDGRVIFFSIMTSTDGVKLEFSTEIVCKNRKRKYGKKVTGLAFKNLNNLSDEKVGNRDTPDTPKKKKTKFKKAAKFAKNVFLRKTKAIEQVLITSCDSRLRLVGLNDHCMVRKYKGHLNVDMRLKARFSESGDFIIIGSETGKCIIWNTATGRNPLNVNVTGMRMYDKVKAFERFDVSTAHPPFVTEAQFAPRESTKNAFLNCGLFPTLTSLDHIQHDFSSAMVVTCDCDGTIRVFLRRLSFDAVVHASGPSGFSDEE